VFCQCLERTGGTAQKKNKSYGQASRGKQRATDGIWWSGDETFGLPILVAMELASGFIFSEVECENLPNMVGAGE